jgi:hypothetical protein
VLFVGKAKSLLATEYAARKAWHFYRLSGSAMLAGT